MIMLFAISPTCFRTRSMGPGVGFACAVLLSWMALPAVAVETEIAIDGPKWTINGAITYPGSAAEGLLMNVRAVNSTFEDRNRPDFDPDANTAGFIAKLPEYIAHGMLGYTLCLQGGMPGYEGAVNSAFTANGDLRESYMNRVKRVIEACDEHGAVVILGCFYQRQDQVLESEQAVRDGLVNVVDWIRENELTNVVLEVTNEFGHGGFDHPILKSAEGQVELILLAKKTNPDLLVSTSAGGHGRFPDSVAEVADFLLIHFNNTPVNEIPGRIQALHKHNKPIVCNEDDKLGEEAAQAATFSVENGASWGLMLQRHNQWLPFTFNGAADDPIVYARVKELTTSR